MNGWYLCNTEFLLNGKEIYTKETMHRTDVEAKSAGVYTALFDFIQIARMFSLRKRMKCIKHDEINYSNIKVYVYISFLKDYSMMENSEFVKRCSLYGASGIHDTFHGYSENELFEIREALTGIKKECYLYDGSLHYIRTIRYNAFTDIDFGGIVDKQNYDAKFNIGDIVLVKDGRPYEVVVCGVPGGIYSTPMWSDQYIVKTKENEIIPYKYNADELKMVKSIIGGD